MTRPTPTAAPNRRLGLAHPHHRCRRHDRPQAHGAPARRRQARRPRHRGLHAAGRGGVSGRGVAGGRKPAATAVVSDLAASGEADKLVTARPDVIYHLAGVVSGEAELDFAKGYRVNLEGMQALLAAIRAAGESYHPKLIFTSSIAVYGAPFPDVIPDDFHLTPLTSYGAQKAMC